MKNVKQSGKTWVISIESPPGYIWVASGTHEYIGAIYYTKPTLAQRDKELSECLRLGVIPCDIVDCDWCSGA